MECRVRARRRRFSRARTRLSSLYESHNLARVIPTDGRSHDATLEPSWMGDGVGHWEGDTLVMDTVNFTDESWLGPGGYFHSDAMHVTERLTRQGDTLRYEVTVEDPNVFTKPWVMNPRTIVLNEKGEHMTEDAPCVDTRSGALGREGPPESVIAVRNFSRSLPFAHYLRGDQMLASLLRRKRFAGSDVIAAAAALALLVCPGAALAKPSPAGAACDQACLTKVMDQYLDHLVQHKTDGVPLAADAILRENTSAGEVGRRSLEAGKRNKGPAGLPRSGQRKYLFVDRHRAERRAPGANVRAHQRGGRKITEIETVINTGIGADKTSPYPGGPYNYDNTLEQEIVFPAPIPVARRSSREDLIKIANGYFESLGMADPGAARFGARCLRYESGSGGGFCGAVVGAAVPGGGRGGRGDVAVTDPGAPGAAGAGAAPAASAAPGGPGAPGGRGAGPGRGGAQARQQTIERRFPVAIPDLGIVVGYMFIMHHERTPPQDNFINEIFKIVDGKIREIDAVGFQVTAPGRSGYPAGLPRSGNPPRDAERRTARTCGGDASSSTAKRCNSWCAHWCTGSAEAGRGRGGRGFGGPQVIPNFPKPPYPGITEVRDLAYGSDPKQRIDILTPTAKSSKPRTVVIFVHGGGWVGGDKHAPGDDLYENVILWAAKQGMVGVNVNYRLADYDKRPQPLSDCRNKIFPRRSIGSQ